MATPEVSKPFFEFSNEDQTALVVSAALVSASLTVLSIVAKLAVRRGMFSLRLFDYILFIGAALLLVQTGLIVSAASSGLGLHADASGVDKEKVRKLQYSTSILTIAITACTKFSMSLLIKMINDYGLIYHATRLLLALLSILALTSILATIFRCPLPSPWLASSPEACPNARSIYLYHNIANIITDLLLCVLGVCMVWNVNTGVKRKALVMALFGLRIICPITVFPAIIGSTQHLYSGADDDFTWLSVWPIVWLQCSCSLAIMTVCVPSIKVILDSFFDNGRRMVMDNPFQLTSISRAKGLQDTTTAGSLVPIPTSYKFTTISRSRNKANGSDGQSESVRNLTEGIIHVHEEIDVHFDDPRPPSCPQGA